MNTKFHCKCGNSFATQSHIREHIGLCNPKWPRTSPDDKHIQITQEEYRNLNRAIAHNEE